MKKTGALIIMAFYGSFSLIRHSNHLSLCMLALPKAENKILRLIENDNKKNIHIWLQLRRLRVMYLLCWSYYYYYYFLFFILLFFVSKMLFVIIIDKISEEKKDKNNVVILDGRYKRIVEHDTNDVNREASGDISLRRISQQNARQNTSSLSICIS